MNTPDSQSALAALIERYGGTLESFRNLRSDCYEKTLAAQSLERLEQLYAELFKPGQKLIDAREKCPQWPPGSRQAGNLPSLRILSEISERINTESALNNLSRVQRFTEKVQKRAEALAPGEKNKTLDTIIALVTEELVAARLAGQPISSNLEIVDRLQSQAVIAQNDKRLTQNDQKIAQTQAALNLKIRQYEDQLTKVREIATAAQAKGGLTPETLAKIAEAAKLL